MIREPRPDAFPRTWGEPPEPADPSRTVAASAPAVERFSHVVLGRVVVEGDLLPGLDACQRKHVPPTNHRVRFTAVVGESPVESVQDLLRPVPCRQVNVQVPAHLHRVARGGGSELAVDGE
jgi:hypothetical protein